MEKFVTYQAIPTLQEYVLVRQDYRHVTVFRRADSWEGETFGAGQWFELASLGLTLAVDDLYQRTDVPAEPPPPEY